MGSDREFVKFVCEQLCSALARFPPDACSAKPLSTCKIKS
jgi:hypothetical protein